MPTSIQLVEVVLHTVQPSVIVVLHAIARFYRMNYSNAYYSVLLESHSRIPLQA